MTKEVIVACFSCYSSVSVKDGDLNPERTKYYSQDSDIRFT